MRRADPLCSGVRVLLVEHLVLLTLRLRLPVHFVPEERFLVVHDMLHVRRFVDLLAKLGLALHPEVH